MTMLEELLKEFKAIKMNNFATFNIFKFSLFNLKKYRNL